MNKQNKYLLRRIYNLINHNNHIFIIKRLRGEEGWCDKENICLNVIGNDNPISTLIHECLHYFYDWSEKEIIKKEKEICRQLSNKQIKYLYQLLVNLL